MFPFLTKIVGNKFRGIDAKIAITKLNVGEELTYEREPANKYDPNAVAVYNSEAIMLGYVPAKDAVIINTPDTPIPDNLKLTVEHVDGKSISILFSEEE